MRPSLIQRPMVFFFFFCKQPKSTDFLLKKKIDFNWLCRVLVSALRTFSCSMWDLVPNQGSNPGPLGAQSLSLWTAREVPEVRLYGLHHCHCSVNIDRRYTNTWPWLCSNKTLFIKTGRGPAFGLYGLLTPVVIHQTPAQAGQSSL